MIAQTARSIPAAAVLVLLAHAGGAVVGAHGGVADVPGQPRVAGVRHGAVDHGLVQPGGRRGGLLRLAGVGKRQVCKKRRSHGQCELGECCRQAERR